MKSLDFKTAFKYPFSRAKGMWNILWVLLPIIGWFALGGYSIRIIQEFIKGKFKELPTFNFSSDLSLGFFMFLKAIPFTLAYMIIVGTLTTINPWLRFVSLPFEIFLIPMLYVHFMKKMTVGSLFEFRIIKPVIDNIGDYIVVILKSILLAIIFMILIVILVGIPAGAFTKNMFLADFYRRRVK
jgi:hypothetical protein